MSLSGPAASAIDAGARFSVIGVHNHVVPALVAAAGLATATCGFIAVAPNRLVSGQPVALWLAADPRLSVSIAGLGALLLAASFVPPRRSVHLAAAAIAAALVLLILGAAGQAAAVTAASAAKLARVSLGAAFWVMLVAAALAIIDGLQRAGAGIVIQLITVLVIAAGFVAMAESGLFEALSLAREYRTREAQFGAALVRHIVLVAAAIGPAVLIGFPLGVGAVRRPDWQGSVFALLNLLQTIPSIALFGLLLVPLSTLSSAVPSLAALGVGGIGMAPAIIALVLYALLPVVRSTVAGLSGVDRGVIDAARGMGMTRRQRFWEVELPLAAPVLLAGLRIVTVQTIGLAVVAALIGAGGLGSFVFQGLGQYAADLVLLGALPAIGLALAADFLLQSATALLRRRAEP
ncbi:MAG: ABC transporter permease [Alphaproteobacteria bacterium]|nr:ABC transporter permease [Alphaproteobacteria bacterium]